MGLSEKENKNKYPNFKDLRVRVLEPCIEEINQYTDIHIEYELIKRSRKIESIRLTIEIRDIIERMEMYKKRRATRNNEND